MQIPGRERVPHVCGWLRVIREISEEDGSMEKAVEVGP